MSILYNRTQVTKGKGAIDRNVNSNNVVATFSIVGFDPETKEIGVAVQSKFIAVGSVVPWAKAGVGAVATQSYANTTYGPQGLELMASGKTAEETLKMLTDEDEGRSQRQAGIVDSHGNSATYTGDECYDWAGGIARKNFAAQGNILVGQETVQAMADTFENTVGSLAERLLKALDAGQEAGGDSRGKQSAVLLIVKEKGGYSGFNDRAVDLRVDDHTDPIKELIRLYKIHQLYFGEVKESEILVIDEEMKSVISQQLINLGFLNSNQLSSNEQVYKSLRDFIHAENFEERDREAGKIDATVYEYIKSRKG